MIDHCAAAAVGEPVLAASADGGTWHLRGRLTFDDVASVYATSKTLPLPTRHVVDLSGVTHADSAGLAMLVALMRRASVEHHPLVLAAMPDALAALARVYGIEELVALPAETGAPT